MWAGNPAAGCWTGQIQRGSGETIRAVIWLCDLRGFTICRNGFRATN
jgi:hypothetical protein